MKKFLVILFLLSWTAGAWAQGFEVDMKRPAYEWNQDSRQRDQMRQQRYELEEMERRARQAETDRDRMQSDRDFERYRNREPSGR